MTTTERLYRAVRDLPEPAIAEVLDFAEFLRAKLLAETAGDRSKSLVDLAGGLERSTTFAGDALMLQRRLRDEWH